MVVVVVVVFIVVVIVVLMGIPRNLPNEAKPEDPVSFKDAAYSIHNTQ